MARLQEELFTELYEITNPEKSLVVVIDMINGFVREGVMSDPQIEGCIPAIKKVLDQNVASVFAIDAHDEDAIEFSSFPMHCVKGTSESEVVAELLPYAKECIYKNSTNLFHAINPEEFVKRADTFILVGCCTDICVMQFALTLRTYLNQKDLKKEVVLLVDGVDTYNADYHNAFEYNKMALQMMSQSGVKVYKGIK